MWNAASGCHETRSITTVVLEPPTCFGAIELTHISAFVINKKIINSAIRMWADWQ